MLKQVNSLGRLRASFFAGMMIVSSAFVLMDACSFGRDGYVGWSRTYPGPSVVVGDVVFLPEHRDVSVSAENAVDVAHARVVQSALSNFFFQPYPAGVKPIEESRNSFVF